MIHRSKLQRSKGSLSGSLTSNPSDPAGCGTDAGCAFRSPIVRNRVYLLLCVPKTCASWAYAHSSPPSWSHVWRQAGVCRPSRGCDDLRFVGLS